jgi:hypothetical protein
MGNKRTNENFLFEGQTANANSTATIDWPGGKGTVVGYGTWDTSSLKFQWSPDGGTTYIDLALTAMTANDYDNFEIGPGKIRANLSSVGASTSVNAQCLLYTCENSH